jgi:hypothetical protein
MLPDTYGQPWPPSERTRYLLAGRFRDASRFAARKDLHLSEWAYVSGPKLEEVIAFERITLDHVVTHVPTSWPN